MTTTQSADKAGLPERLHRGCVYLRILADKIQSFPATVDRKATDALMREAADEIDRLRAEVGEGRRALIASGIVSDLLVENAGDERDTERRKRRNAEERVGIWEGRATAAEAALSAVTAERDAILSSLSEEEAERVERDKLAEDNLSLIDYIADKIGLPDDQELSEVAFALWLDANEAQVRALREALKNLADAADNVGIRFFDTDDLPPEVERLQSATLAARAALTDAPAQPSADTIARLAACGINDPSVLDRMRAVMDEDVKPAQPSGYPELSVEKAP